MAKQRALLTLCVWGAFVLRGTLHALTAPIWDGFDEPFHLAYVLFVGEHGRPPGFDEPSFPAAIMDAIPALPTFVAERRPIARWDEAPGFRAWRAMSAEEKARRRALAERFAWTPYVGPNYERQQPPLFYVLSAPVALLFRGASLPALVVALRVWCVLLASLAVPLTARFLRIALPARGVALGLPLLLLPNTLFFVFRVTNDALAFALMPAICGALVLTARRPAPRRALALGLLCAAGVWTKLTLLPVLPAALAAVLLARRRAAGRRVAIAAGALVVPALLVAPLLAWNAISSGSATGLIHLRDASPGLSGYLRALVQFDVRVWVPLWARTHLWAGGWGFVQPPPRVAGAIVLALLGALAAVAMRSRRRAMHLLARSRPVLVLALLFVGAMVFHVVAMVATAALRGVPPPAGGEGWYFDILRPIEALVVAALLVAALPRVGAQLAVAMELALVLSGDALGTLTLLVSFWAGRTPGAWPSLADVSAALDAAPLAFPHALAGLLAVGVVACAGAAVAATARRRGSG